MKKFSQKKGNQILNFFELIDPNISDDFLMGIYLSIFRRDKWEKNLKVLNKKLIKDKNGFQILTILVLILKFLEKLLKIQKHTSNQNLIS